MKFASNYTFPTIKRDKRIGVKPLGSVVPIVFLLTKNPAQGGTFKITVPDPNLQIAELANQMIPCKKYTLPSLFLLSYLLGRHF